MMMLLVTFAVHLNARIPFELGVVAWWTCVVFPWFVLTLLMLFGKATQDLQILCDAVLSGSSLVISWRALTVTIIAVFCCSFGMFFWLCNHNFLSTFLKHENPTHFLKRTQWLNQSNRSRALLLTRMHPSLLRSIKGEAMEWLSTNMESWEMSPPTWFTDRWKCALPRCVLSDDLYSKFLCGQKLKGRKITPTNDQTETGSTLVRDFDAI